MGTFTPLILSVCLKVLGWLMIVVSGLMVILLLRKWFFGEPDMPEIIYASLGFVFGGIGSLKISNWVERHVSPP